MQVKRQNWEESEEERERIKSEIELKNVVTEMVAEEATEKGVVCPKEDRVANPQKQKCWASRQTSSPSSITPK